MCLPKLTFLTFYFCWVILFHLFKLPPHLVISLLTFRSSKCFNTACSSSPHVGFSESLCHVKLQIDVPVNLKEFINLFFLQSKCKKKTTLPLLIRVHGNGFLVLFAVSASLFQTFYFHMNICLFFVIFFKPTVLLQRNPFVH